MSSRMCSSPAQKSGTLLGPFWDISNVHKCPSNVPRWAGPGTGGVMCRAGFDVSLTRRFACQEAVAAVAAMPSSQVTRRVAVLRPLVATEGPPMRFDRVSPGEGLGGGRVAPLRL